MSVTGPAPRTNAPPLVLVVLLSATFVQLLNASTVYVAVSGIQTSLQTTSAAVQFVLVGYQLGFACTLITGARLGDILGRKRVFLLGMVAFTLTSVLCSVAPTIEVLIVARVLQGVTSGLMFPQVLSFIQVLFTAEGRAKALGSYGAAIGLGSILGPTIGGALIQADLSDDPWRAIFLVNVPIGLAAALAAWKLLPESVAPTRPRLDLPGTALSAAGLALVLYALGTAGDGAIATTGLLLVAGLAALAVFVANQRARSRRDEDPVLDTRLFQNRGFAVGTVMSLVFYAGVPAFFLVFSLYLIEGQRSGPLLAGLATLPYAVGTVVASINADAAAARWGRWVLAVGAGLMVLGMTVLIMAAEAAGTAGIGWWLVPGLLLGGIGFGLFIPPATDVVLDGVPETRVGAASGTLTSVQQIGGAVGVTLVSYIFFGTLADPATAGAAQVRQSYTDALVNGLLFEIVVFAVTALLVLALPVTAKKAPVVAAEVPPSPATAAGQEAAP